MPAGLLGGRAARALYTGGWVVDRYSAAGLVRTGRGWGVQKTQQPQQRELCTPKPSFKVPPHANPGHVKALPLKKKALPLEKLA
jgi:hypothetical protein